MSGLNTPVLRLLAVFGFLLTFCCLPSSLTAQKAGKYPGFIVSVKGDTTFGTLITGKNVYVNQRRIQFVDELGIRSRYDAELIAGYGFEDSTYASLTRPFDFRSIFERDSVFMAVIVAGPATLYRYFPPKLETPLAGGVEFVEYLRMPNGVQYALTVPHFRDRLALAFAGLNEFTAKVTADKLSWEEVPALIREYNRYVEAQQSGRGRE